MMSKSRQSPARAEIVLRSLAVSYGPGTVLERHSHAWAQLVYASEGVMRVETEDGVWVVPSHRAVWIPAGVGHAIAMSGHVAMRTLYLAPELTAALPAGCCVVEVAPLLRELVLHAVARAPLRLGEPEHERLIGFLLDQLAVLPVVPLELPMPRDPRALRVATRLRDDPGAAHDLDALARSAGASRRTLERLFQRETGIPLGRWRQQARLLHALDLLAQGQPVTSVALEVGYESPSSFIAVFTDAFGTTPGRYHRPGGAAPNLR
jgi:AraC-like DNA-binding protein